MTDPQNRFRSECAKMVRIGWWMEGDATVSARNLRWAVVAEVCESEVAEDTLGD
jgi:hypothetical protein